MLADRSPAAKLPAPSPPASRGADPRGVHTRLGARAAPAVAFVGAFGMVALYALNGGAYDQVAFELYGLIVWWVLALCLALGLLPRQRPASAMLALLGALAAYAAWTALSLLWSDSAQSTFTSLARTLDYLGLVALVALSLDRATWRAAAGGLAAGALAVCLAADLSRLVPGAFPTDYVATALHSDRLSYPFGYWNAVAAWATMSLAIGLAWSAHDRRWAARAATLGLVPAAVAADYLSYSRAGVAGAALALVLVAALSRNRLTAAAHALLAAAASAIVIAVIQAEPQIAQAGGTGGAGAVLGALAGAFALCAAGAILTRAGGIDRRSVPARVARPLAVLACLALVAGAAAFGPHLAARAWRSFKNPTVAQAGDPATRLLSLSGSRYYVWKAALAEFDSRPLTGTGAGTFGLWWSRHGTTDEFVRDAHNIWLQSLGELGAVGLALIAAAMAAALAVAVAARRRMRRSASAGAAAGLASALGVYLMHASVDWMWESTAVTVLALAGVAVLGARLGRPMPGRLRLPLRALAAALALGAAWVQVPGLLSTTDVRNSQAAERSGHPALALAWADDAVAAEPWAASPYDQKGLVLEAAGDLNAALQSLRIASVNDPDNLTHWVLLARVQAERGHLAAAARDYEQARRLGPHASVLLFAPYFKS